MDWVRKGKKEEEEEEGLGGCFQMYTERGRERRKGIGVTSLLLLTGKGRGME